MRGFDPGKSIAHGLLALFLVVAVFPAEGRTQTVPFHIGHASINSRMAPLWVAAKEGFFKKQGFDVRVVSIRGGTQVTQALLGGGFKKRSALSPVRPLRARRSLLI